MANNIVGILIIVLIVLAVLWFWQNACGRIMPINEGMENGTVKKELEYMSSSLHQMALETQDEDLERHSIAMKEASRHNLREVSLKALLRSLEECMERIEGNGSDVEVELQAMCSCLKEMSDETEGEDQENYTDHRAVYTGYNTSRWPYYRYRWPYYRNIITGYPYRYYHPYRFYRPYNYLTYH